MRSRKKHFLPYIAIIFNAVIFFDVRLAWSAKEEITNIKSAPVVEGGAQDMTLDDVAIIINSPVTLYDALSLGVATNPEYGAVAANRRATDEGLLQGKALFRPVINMRADTGYEYSDDPATRSGPKDKANDLSRFETSVTLTQLLFDGWESKNEVLRQHARVDSSAHRVRETVELVGLSIVEAYLEILRQREILLIAQQNVSDHLAIFMLIRDGVKAGRSTLADKEQARSRVAAARTTQISTRQALRNAEANYRRGVGVAPADELVVPVIPTEALSKSVEEEVLQALAHSPTLDIFEADIQSAHAEAQQTRASFFPQVDLQLNARQGHDLNGVDGRDTSASALVVMNWNLYRGGADKARHREFLHRHKEAKESRERASRAVENDVYQTWASMEAASGRSEQFATQVEANEKVVAAYKDQFSLGRRTLLDLLDIQTELFASRSNKVNSEFLEMLAVYRLLVLKGSLLSSMGIEYPSESVLSSKK